jgi:hypothetical protein
MADYYPLLLRAVSRLEDNTGAARLELYERARTIAVAQLRAQAPKRSETEIMDELVALEMAILKVEREVPAPAHAPKPAPSPAAPPKAALPPAHASKAAPTPAHPSKAAPPQAAAAINRGNAPAERATAEMAALPESLGIMLIGIALIMGMVAFIGVLYVRGLVLVSAEVINYPILIAAMAILLCLFVALSLALFRRARIVALLDHLLKFTYSTLRRRMAPF